jgi:hypothetical protein
MVQAESAQFKRDLLEERSKSQKLLAADKASKVAAERAEAELRKLRERTAEQLTDANNNKGELWKQMMQTKEQADRERKGLVEQLDDAKAALEAANARCDNEKSRSSMLQFDMEKMKKNVRHAPEIALLLQTP